jgi:hypothetical protein
MYFNYRTFYKKSVNFFTTFHRCLVKIKSGLTPQFYLDPATHHYVANHWCRSMRIITVSYFAAHSADATHWWGLAPQSRRSVFRWPTITSPNSLRWRHILNILQVGAPPMAFQSVHVINDIITIVSVGRWRNELATRNKGTSEINVLTFEGNKIICMFVKCYITLAIFMFHISLKCSWFSPSLKHSFSYYGISFAEATS